MAKIRSFKPLKNGRGIRLRFTHDGTLYAFSLKGLNYDNPIDFNHASKICQQISNDCELGCFYTTLERYGKEPEIPLEAHKIMIFSHYDYSYWDL
jgi:hypothetical protein